jgi:hypothetical protein
MRSLPKPAHLEIQIDEWQVAQKNIDAIHVEIKWRGAHEDSTLEELLASLPPRNELVPIRLLDGRTELAFKGWQRIRFGKGPAIFEAARSNYEAWAGGSASGGLATTRKNLVDMIRRYVPDFDSYTDKEQVDFIIRTQEEINAIHDSVEDLIAHLEYAAPDRNAVPPLKEDPRRNVQAAVFWDVAGSSRRAGELLGIPPSPSDEPKRQNQNVSAMAKLGRQLLHYHFGEEEWKIKLARMRKYRQWWEQYEALDDPKEQFYALLAIAGGTTAECERFFAEQDGFDSKLDEWITVVESRLKIEEIQDQNKYSDDFAWPGTDEGRRRRLQDEQFRIQATDERFDKALSVFDAPPDGMP